MREARRKRTVVKLTRRASVFSLTAALCVFAAVAAAQADCAAPERWEEYVNPRFGTRLEVPLDCFYPQPPPENGDGQSFLAEEGQVRLSVYGAHNTQNHTPRELKQWLVEEVGGYEQVTYAPMGKSWLVLSGYRGGEIFYEKYILSHGGRIMNAFWITFPRRRKPVFAPIIERMEDSFRAGEGADTP